MLGARNEVLLSQGSVYFTRMKDQVPQQGRGSGAGDACAFPLQEAGQARVDLAPQQKHLKMAQRHATLVPLMHARMPLPLFNEWDEPGGRQTGSSSGIAWI